MLAKVYSMGLKGARGYPVLVELDVANGLPCFVTVGLPGSALKEARERVASAVRNSGFRFPQRRVTVNLAPALARKEGTHFDLPIALAALAASGQVRAGERWAASCFVGELALDGSLRPVPGVLAMALEARARGFESIVVPAANAAEAAAGGLTAVPVSCLRDAAAVFGVPAGDGEDGEGPLPGACAADGDAPAAAAPGVAAGSGTLPAVVEAGGGTPRPELVLAPPPRALSGPDETSLCLSDVKGQVVAKRALEVAAAGGHHVLLIGPPGVGKSMLARRLASLLPEPDAGEALEIARIHSLMNPLSSMARARPFRAPHHTASTAALVGGGAPVRPGEVALAHAGVLFLDELGEFRQESLDALRQILEEGRVVVARAAEMVEYPAMFQLVAATNACPCGHRGHAGKECRCPPPAAQRYLSRLSGPLMDRIDIQVEMSALDFKEWASSMGAPCPAGGERPVETSARVRERVRAARAVQAGRSTGSVGSRGGAALNAHLPQQELKVHCALDEAGMRLAEAACERMQLSARSLDRALKVARTVADLAGSERILPEHLSEALRYRRLDRLVNQNRRETT